MARTVRIGIVGRHFGSRVHGAAFSLNDDCDVVSVVSRDWRALAESADIDAVSIAVPPLVQREIAQYCINSGKHVFLEKPVTAGRQEAWHLLSLVKKARVAAMVNFELPFMKTWKEAKRLLNQGEIGRLQKAEITWTTMSYSEGRFDNSWKFNSEAGGGMLNNFGSHLFNYVEYFFGTVRSIHCEREFVTHNGDLKFDAAVRLRMKAALDLPVSVKMDGRGKAPKHRIEFVGSNGTLVLENTFKDYISGFVLKKNQAVLMDEKHAAQYEDGRIWATAQVVGKFVESIQTGKLNSPLLADACRSEDLIEFAIHANREKTEVKV